MEDDMKTTKIIRTMFLILTILAGMLEAQQSNQKYNSRTDWGRKNFLNNLRSDNDGVIESTLMFVMQLRMKQPMIQLGDISTVIDSLTTQGSSSSIRYKAQLAAQVCSEPKLFADLHNWSSADQQGFYSAVADRLQKQLFGMKSL
jgi:hypothetical protein